MLELHQLRTFVVVAEERHFTRAAARLHIAQPAVSQQIRALERSVGQGLFERNARGVRLTIAGQVLLPHARAALRAAEVGFAEVAATTGALRGTLRAGVVDSATSMPAVTLLTEFHRAHSDVDLVIRRRGSAEMLDDVRSAALDVAFVAFADPQGPHGLSMSRPIPEPVVVGMAPQHRLATSGELTLAEIASEPLVALREGTGNRAMVEQVYAEAGVRPRIVCDAENVDIAIDCVAANLGICLFAASTVAAAAPAVVAAALTEPQLQRYTTLVWRSPQAASPLARAFVTFAESRTSTGRTG
jgi:DNA-binding transcriptional LysR family regulator